MILQRGRRKSENVAKEKKNATEFRYALRIHEKKLSLRSATRNVKRASTQLVGA
jgi:hypothetical protein